MSNVRTMATPMTMTRFIGLTPTLEHSRVDAQARSPVRRRVKNESAPDSRELSISATGTSLGRKSGSCVIGRESP